ncbi:unnamed protein product [Mortierella alpina]
MYSLVFLLRPSSFVLPSSLFLLPHPISSPPPILPSSHLWITSSSFTHSLSLRQSLCLYALHTSCFKCPVFFSHPSIPLLSPPFHSFLLFYHPLCIPLTLT